MKTFKIFISILATLVFTTSALSAEVFFYDTDNVGTPVAMWNTKSNKAWEAEYYPFGQEYRSQNIKTNNKNRFIGKERDKETGLTYFGARYFDERSGRLLTPDPVRVVDPFTSKTNHQLLANPQRLNRYTYGLNNPYRYIDPDGRDPDDIDHDGDPDVGLNPNEGFEELRVNPLLSANNPNISGAGIPGRTAGSYMSAQGAKKGYRAVSDAELDDIARHGFRPHPEGKSMQDKWFSETREGAKKFTKTFPNQKNIVEAEVPSSVYDKSYKHPNIDNTGPGFAVPVDDLSKVRPR